MQEEFLFYNCLKSSMGSDICSSVQSNVKQKSIVFQENNNDQGKKTTVVFHYIHPVKCDEAPSIGEEEETKKEESKTRTSSTLNREPRSSQKKLNSLGGKENFTKENIVFLEDDKSDNQTEEVQMKKVKVKWNDFIKMKKKKFSDDYYILKEIGKGGYGSVYKVLRKEGKIFRAAKKIEKEQLKEDEHENLLNEMAIMMSLDHPNILKLFEVYDQKNYYVMVMELCEGGELFDRIVNYQIQEKQVIHTTKQILSALHYMHSKGVVHRDIKPENILYEKKTRLIKIIDFGISVRITPGETLSARLGTPYYIAPEVLCKKYNEKCDIWSTGVVIYMMLTGSPPFKGKDAKQVMDRVFHSQIVYPSCVLKSYSPDCIYFVKKLLVKNVKERLSAKKALKHSWINNGKENQIELEQKGKIMNRLQNFKFKNKLEAVVHTYIVSQLLTSEERNFLIEYFKDFDKNKNGVIQIQEIRYALKQNPSLLHENDERIQKILDYIDTNCSGQIDFTEFLVAAIDPNQHISKKHFQQAFSYFDIDNSGAITFEEISQFLDDGSSNIKQLFEAVDKNGDGLISKDQFVQLLMKKM